MCIGFARTWNKFSAHPFGSRRDSLNSRQKFNLSCPFWWQRTSWLLRDLTVISIAGWWCDCFSSLERPTRMEHQSLDNLEGVCIFVELKMFSSNIQQVCKRFTFFSSILVVSLSLPFSSSCHPSMLSDEFFASLFKSNFESCSVDCGIWQFGCINLSLPFGLTRNSKSSTFPSVHPWLCFWCSFAFCSTGLSFANVAFQELVAEGACLCA